MVKSLINKQSHRVLVHTIYSSDLKAAGKDTILVKYANDTTLIYPDQTAASLADEFRNIQEWAKQNRLEIKISKTKEITFHKPNPHKHLLLAPMLDIEQVSNCKLLRIVVCQRPCRLHTQNLQSTSLFA